MATGEEEVTITRDKAKAAGCTCEWHGRHAIIEFGNDCPVLDQHRRPHNKEESMTSYCNEQVAAGWTRSSMGPVTRAEIPAVAQQEWTRGDEVRVVDPVTGGEKGQKGERYDLIPAVAHQELARVFGFGSAKYADDNWRKGYSWRLSVGALERHLAAWKQGESVDAESGCHHLAHAAWHCYVLQTFEREGLGTDDIPERPKLTVEIPARDGATRHSPRLGYAPDTRDDFLPEDEVW